MASVSSTPRGNSLRVRALWRSPEDQPRWARPALLGLTVVAGFLYAWNATGNLEIYYAAAVRSMSMSWHDFVFASFDPVSAQASGLPTALLDAILLVALAVTIIVSLQAAGIVLVAALLVTPAATAFQLTNRFGRMMAYAATFGLSSSVIGLYASYYLDAASGSTIVLCATAFFFVAVAFSPKRRSLLTAVMEARGNALQTR